MLVVGNENKNMAREPQQVAFSKEILKIIKPEILKFGFKKYTTKNEEYYTNLVFRKSNQYIRIEGTNYPRDYPYFWNIILGEGSSDDFFEYDWNSVALWHLKNKIENEICNKEYPFPTENELSYSILNAKNELLKFGQSFLLGNLELFYEVRKEINQKRETYKIHSPDGIGGYIVSNEPKSELMKRKFT